MSATMEHVVEATDATFEQLVIEGSKERPVVVDLWAAWCGPCRVIGPILEKVAGERDGAFLLAKVDVDANGVGQALLQAVGSQGIPTVVAFKDGQPASMFIGAYPEAEVNRFVDALLPSEADLGAEEAEAEYAAGDLDAAEAGFRDALEKEPGNKDASLGLAGVLIARGKLDEARPIVMAHLPDAGAEALHARIEVMGWADEASPGALGAAKRDAAEGRWEPALKGMLGALGEDRDAARQAMLTVFTVLGEEHELVTEHRRRLTASLY